VATRDQAPPSTTPAAAAAAATALPPGAAGAGAAAGSAVAAGAVVLSAAEIGRLTAKLTASILKFEAAAFDQATAAALVVLGTQYPKKRRSDLEAVLSIESKFEREFRRKMKERLNRDLPKALSIVDPVQREAAVRAIMEREKRYSLAREEAMLQRALGKMEAQLLRDISPEGAFWKLSPHVKQHTLDCLAMGNRFWPWSVLKRIQPPLHPGCPCYLLGLDEAIEAGLMTKAMVPEREDAENRYTHLKKSVESLEDRDDLQEAIEEVFVEIAARELDLEEARRRIPLRWHKGFSKGGEFRPTRGGSAGARLIKKLLGDGRTPVRGRDGGSGRWAWVRGVYTRIPEQSRWEARRGGSTYHSPPGSTALYRDGALISLPGLEPPARERRSPGTASPVRDERVESLAEQIRAEARSVARERGGIQRGDGASELLALLDEGFRLEDSKNSAGTREMVLTYRAPAGEQLDVVYNGEEVLDVAWGGVAVSERKSIGRRAPASWTEFAEDSLAWADELGDRFDAEVLVPSIKANRDRPDHAGNHRWSGKVELGIEAQTDIERAAVARQEMRPLTNDQLRGVYSAYWVAAHEVSHGVNPISFQHFNGANVNLEEALTEELAHQLAVERLTEQNQMDVVDWQATHPYALAVRGTYQEAREALGRLIDRAGVVEPKEKRELLEELKFKVEPEARIDTLAGLIHRQYPSASIDEIRLEVRESLENPVSLGDAPPMLDNEMSPGMAQVGRGEYGKLDAGTLSSDGKTLAGLPDGSIRTIEKLPLHPAFPELEGMTDGTALVKYGPDQRPTSGLEHRDGTAKSFRYVDDENRARLILRALAGKGSPGVVHEFDDSEVAEVAAALDDGGLVYVRGEVPVKKRFDDSFGVGFAGRDGRNLSGVVGPQNAAKLALYRADTSALLLGKASPGTRIGDFRLPPPATDHGSTAGDDAPNTEISLTPRSYAEYQAARAAQKERLGLGPPSPAELLLPDPPENPGTWLPWFGGKDKRKGGKSAGKPTPKIFSDKPRKPKPPEFIGGKKGVADDGPIPNYDGVRLELGKGAGGSNGARWAFDKDGGRWLVKTYRGDPDRIATEILANRVYAQMGAKVADAGTIHTKDGKTALTYKALDGAPKEYVFKRGTPSKEVGEHYMVDALLANWDFAGMTDDNIMWDDEGKPFRVDQGGTFEYKAMGGSKPYGPVPTEVWTMIQKGQAKRASDVTEDQMREQGAEVERVMTAEVIDGLVDAAPFANDEMRERIRENMKARVAWMGAFSRGEVELPKPLEGDEARDAFVEAQDELQAYPEEIEALKSYVGGDGFAINEVLKKGGEWSATQKKTIKALDEVIKISRTSEDMHLYIGVDLPIADLPAEMMGKTLGDAGFAHATTDLDAAGESQGVIKILLPEGSKALYVPDMIAADAGATEPEVIMPRGSRLKLTGVKDGQLTATLLPPNPPKPKWTQPKFKDKGWAKGGGYIPPAPQSSIWDDVDDGMKSPGTGGWKDREGTPLSVGQYVAVLPHKTPDGADWEELGAEDFGTVLAVDDAGYVTVVPEEGESYGIRNDLVVVSERAKWNPGTGAMPPLGPQPNELRFGASKVIRMAVDDPYGENFGIIDHQGEHYEAPDGKAAAQIVAQNVIDHQGGQGLSQAQVNELAARIDKLPPPAKMNPGTVIDADPRAAKGGISLPHFNTPDPAARQENIDAAKKLRDLALAGDADALKAFKVNPKAKKLAKFRYDMISHVLGPKPGSSPKPKPSSKPAGSSSSAKDDPAIEAEIASKQAALEKDFGITFIDPKGDKDPSPTGFSVQTLTSPKMNRIRSKGWLNILNTVRPEIEAMEARWPGLTKGTKLKRSMPHGGALGVFNTAPGGGDIRLVPTSKTANGSENKYGIVFSIGGGDLGTVFRHEFAHHRDWQTQAKYRDAIKQTLFYDEDGNKITAKQWGKRHISQYSGTMTSEFIAEAWALYTSSGYDGSMGERMDAIMEAMGTGGEPPAPQVEEIPGGHIV
jgi:hypothetical protein